MRYAANWELIPELSLYQFGAPPRSGAYSISRTGDQVAFSVHWTDLEGKNQSVSFNGIVDGKKHDVEHPPGAKASFTHISDTVLDSAMFIDDKQMAYARRQVSQDGTLMVVLQTGLDPDGMEFRNVQVYRRVN